MQKECYMGTRVLEGEQEEESEEEKLEMRYGEQNEDDAFESERPSALKNRRHKPGRSF